MALYKRIKNEGKCKIFCDKLVEMFRMRAIKRKSKRSKGTKGVTPTNKRTVWFGTLSNRVVYFSLSFAVSRPVFFCRLLCEHHSNSDVPRGSCTRGRILYDSDLAGDLFCAVFVRVPSLCSLCLSVGAVVCCYYCWQYFVPVCCECYRIRSPVLLRALINPYTGAIVVSLMELARDSVTIRA